MICSVLIPSRSASAGSLDRAVQSVFATAGNGAVEVLLRLDYDDPLLANRLEVASKYQCLAVVGHRLKGYASCGQFITELCDLAKGKWIAIMDDDGAYEGGSWLKFLAEQPDGVFCQPGIYNLGGSTYRDVDVGPVAMMIPKGSIYPIGDPPDLFMFQTALKKGLKRVLIPGLTFHHYWRQERV
jgi:hypothetical protein